jgi:hypothetical protein
LTLLPTNHRGKRAALRACRIGGDTPASARPCDGDPRHDKLARMTYTSAVDSSAVLELLRPFDPRIVGTLPLGVAVPGSDIDIVCHAPDPNAFEVERRLLALDDGRLRRAVGVQRANGLKTEPAFAAVLGIEGDPYMGLLELAAETDAELSARLAARDMS